MGKDDTPRKLRKIPFPEKWLGGVCSGVAYFYGFHVWAVRLIYFAICLFGFWPLPVAFAALYFLLWLFLPKWKEMPDDFAEVTGD